MAQYFQRISDGAWLQRIDNLDLPPSRHLAHVADEYGSAVEDLRLIEADTDPRTGSLVSPPPRDPTPEETGQARIDQLIAACLDNTATAAQVRELVGRLGRYLRRGAAA